MDDLKNKFDSGRESWGAKNHSLIALTFKSNVDWELTEECRRKLLTLASQFERECYNQLELSRPDLKEDKEKEKLFFEEVFDEAGVVYLWADEIPNEYDSLCHKYPWFNFHTEIGVIKVGSRKRVFVLEWGDSSHIKGSVEELFDDEDVTKYETGIHAWGKEKLVEYLKVLKNNKRF